MVNGLFKKINNRCLDSSGSDTCLMVTCCKSGRTVFPEVEIANLLSKLLSSAQRLIFGPFTKCDLYLKEDHNLFDEMIKIGYKRWVSY